MTDTVTRQPGGLYPPPDFADRFYGVAVAWIGDDGGVVAHGHIGDRRFLAACNKLARRQGMCNLWDDRAATIEDPLDFVIRVWAVAENPDEDPGDPAGWAISWDGVTEQTPGAFPVTILWP